MRTRFKNVANRSELCNPILDATCFLSDGSSLLKAIEAKNDWKYNSGSGTEIVSKILECDLIAPVQFYRSFNPWSRVVGYAKGGQIYINERKAIDYKTIIGNLVHEYMHVVGFTHGNNYKTKDKCLYSVPYFASEWVKENL